MPLLLIENIIHSNIAHLGIIHQQVCLHITLVHCMSITSRIENSEECSIAKFENNWAYSQA